MVSKLVDDTSILIRIAIASGDQNDLPVANKLIKKPNLYGNQYTIY
jgi:hypothetical protein